MMCVLSETGLSSMIEMIEVENGVSVSMDRKGFDAGMCMFILAAGKGHCKFFVTDAEKLI